MKPLNLGQSQTRLIHCEEPNKTHRAELQDITTLYF